MYKPTLAFNLLLLFTQWRVEVMQIVIIKDLNIKHELIIKEFNVK